MKLILDLDGVLVDFVKGALQSVNIEYDYDQYPKGIRDIEEAYNLRMSKADFWNSLNEPRFWENLEWMHDGKEILRLCEKYAGKSNITICTSSGKMEFAAAGKLFWMKLNIPYYVNRHQFLIGPSKHACAAPNRVLVDDYEKNCGLFLAEGGERILVPRPWNKSHEIDTLTHLETELKKFFK